MFAEKEAGAGYGTLEAGFAELRGNQFSPRECRLKDTNQAFFLLRDRLLEPSRERAPQGRLLVTRASLIEFLRQRRIL